MVDIIFIASEIFIIISYLFKNMFFLRFATILGMAGYILGSFIAGYQQPGMMAIIFFSLLAVLINIFQIVILIGERKPIFLPEDVREVYKENFHIMTTKQFYKLYSLAKVDVFEKGSVLIVQNTTVKDLILIKKGSVTIIKDDHNVAELGAGFFAGEMSFLQKKAATATVEVAENNTQCIVWEQEYLETILKNKPELYAQLKQVIANNLIRKIELQDTQNLAKA